MNSAAIAQIQKVVRHVRHVLGDTAPFASDINYLQRFFATNPRSYTIDFERYARSFAAGFFVKNYCHASCLFLQVRRPVPYNVLDWGGGAGATTLGYLTALQLRASDPDRHIVKVTLLDASPAQLELANTILAGAADLFPNLDVRITIGQHALSGWNPVPGEYGGVLFGHILTENEGLVKAALNSSLAALEPGGAVFIIEDSNYPVWHQIDDVIESLPVPRHKYITAIDDLRNLPANEEQGNENLSSTCLVFSSLRSPHALRLLSLYFRSWRERSLELLDAVFSPAAWYIDNSIPVALKGIDSIRAYWHEHVLVQTDFALKIFRVFENDSDVVCEWSASFNSPVHGGPVRFDGTILVTIDEECAKIGKLTEYVNRIPAGRLSDECHG